MATPAPSDDVSDPKVKLIHLTPAQRQEFYKSRYAKRVEPLAHIAPPEECTEWPDLREEILDAYLRYTTFSVRVWTNYDTATKKFYVDARQQDCGRLVLKPSEVQWLNGVNPEGSVQFNRILLEIGTPFSNLCSVKLAAAASKTDGLVDVTVRAWRPDIDHPRAVDFVTNMCSRLYEGGVGIADWQTGMLVSDIENIAAYFCRRPQQHEVTRLYWNRNSGPWMDFDDYIAGNDGWLDLEALGKGCCGGGCAACSGKFHEVRPIW